MPEIIPKTKSAVFLLIASVIFGMTLSIVLAEIGIVRLSNDDLYFISMFIGEGLMLLPVIAFAKRIGTTYSAFFRTKSISLRSLLFVIPVCLGLVITMDELDRVAQLIFPYPELFSKIYEFMMIKDSWSAVLIIGFVVLFGPLFEELLFRGFFQRILEIRLNDVTKAVLFSALTFALVHGNPWGIVQIYIIGVFLGYFAWRTGSIWASFLIHLMNNGFSVLFVNLPKGSLGWYEFHGHVHPIILIVGIALFYFGMRQFIKVTPAAEREENIILIENISKPAEPQI